MIASRLQTTILPLALACLLAAPAVAQTSPAAPVPTPAGGSSMASRMHATVERRIEELHSRLKITAAQQPAFDTFAGVMRENATRMDDLMQARVKSVATQSAVDQMKVYEAVTQAHADDMKRLVPAFETLYGGLSPDQKKIADSSFRDFAKSGGRNRA